MKIQFDLRNGATSCLLQFKTCIPFFMIVLLTGCGFQGRKYTLGNYWDCQTSAFEKHETHVLKRKKEKDTRFNSDILDQNSQLIEVEINSISNVRDTLKIPMYRKPSPKKSASTKDSLHVEEQYIQRHETHDIDQDENKLRRAKNGFLTFWAIESLLYLGLLSNAYLPDVWGFWLFVFGFLTALYFLLTLTFMSILKIRYSRSCDQIKNETLKVNIPKFIRVFVWAAVIQVGLLILAFFLGGN